jgi:hypothetical protein
MIAEIDITAEIDTIAEIDITWGNGSTRTILQLVTSAPSILEGAMAGDIQGELLWIAGRATQLPDSVVSGNAISDGRLRVVDCLQRCQKLR